MIDYIPDLRGRDERFDRVILRHWPGGILTAILPAAASYDHGLLTGSWEDLPVGSLSENGTNVNTSVLTLRRSPDPS